MLRRLAEELESREATPERDELLAETRERIAELSGATYRVERVAGASYGAVGGPAVSPDDLVPSIT